MLPMVLLVAEVAVAVVPLVPVSVDIMPDVSVEVPDGIGEVSVDPVVPVDIVLVVEDVSLDAAAVSVMLVFSSFLQEKANSATVRTIKVANDLFKLKLLNRTSELGAGPTESGPCVGAGSSSRPPHRAEL